MDVFIKPLEGIIINNKNINLGMNKEDIISILGDPEIIYNRKYCTRSYYYNSELAIDYDLNNNVEFIEFLGGIEGNLNPIIYDFSIFKEDDEKINNLLKEKNKGIVDDSNKPYSYVFHKISVGVSKELNSEQKNQISTIGIGVKEYYS